MKLTLFLLFMLIISFSHCFSQSADSAFKLSGKAYYHQKSVSQKTGAWLLVSAGGALCIVSGIVGLSDLNHNGILAPDTKNRQNNETLEKILLITGGAAILGSIPLFVAASRNKHKATSLSVKIERSSQFQNNMVYNVAIPALTLKLHL